MLVNLTGGSDVFAVPMSVNYDASKLSLINVDSDDAQHPNLLGKDGQAVALAHRDDGKGEAAIAISRPPGTTGVSGSGTVCVLTFQAKSPGDASIAISRPVIRNAQQQPESAVGSQAVVHIQ
jgi:general secretion pathway protein D